MFKISTYECKYMVMKEEKDIPQKSTRPRPKINKRNQPKLSESVSPHGN